MNRMLDRHYHRIMAGIPKDQRRFLKDNLICVDITNAAKWFIEESEQEYWEYDKDFPCVVPPWPVAWLEFTNHGFVEKCTGAETLGGVKAVGLRSAIAHEIPEEYRESALRLDFLRTMMDNFGIFKDIKPSKVELSKRTEIIEAEIIKGTKPRWMCVFSLVLEYMQRKPINLSVEGWYLDEMGRPMGILRYGSTAISLSQVNDIGLEEVKKTYESIMLPFLFALSLLHCKNVHVEDTPLTKARARKARKQKNRGNVIYKVMIVDPLRKQVRKDCEKSGRTPLKQALHIVRGHFKDYRDGPGLFGKYHDMYWWDMHARGDAEYGEIKKDYEVRRKRSHARQE